MAKQNRTVFRALLLATHFPQALAMVLLTVSASWLYGQQGSGLFFVFLAVASGQASIGWVNDYLDYENDKALNRNQKPVVRFGLGQKDLKTPIILALAFMVPFSFLAAGFMGGLAHILAVFSAQLYNLYLARTIWSWLPYAVSFGLLSIFVTQSSSLALWPSWQVVVIAISVGVIAHIFNALPDIDIDQRSNLGGFVISLGKSRALALAAVLSALILGLLVNLWLTR